MARFLSAGIVTGGARDQDECRRQVHGDGRGGKDEVCQPRRFRGLRCVVKVAQTLIKTSQLRGWMNHKRSKTERERLKNGSKLVKNRNEKFSEKRQKTEPKRVQKMTQKNEAENPSFLSHFNFPVLARKVDFMRAHRGLVDFDRPVDFRQKACVPPFASF